MTGQIPPQLGNIPTLSTLYLSGNPLTGCIAESLLSIDTNDFSFLNLPSCESIQEAQAADRQALVALYEATDGANWNNNTNWLTHSPVNTWFGVTTNTSGSVIELRLGENGLSGEIPSEIATLPNLDTLYLGGNQFSGCIPLNRASAPAGDVAALGLPFCEIVQIPQTTDRAALVALYEVTDGPNWTNNSNWLTDKPLGTWHGVTTDVNGHATEIFLADNNLSGTIPAELGTLSSLQELSLDRNQLSGEIPPELGNISNLVDLNLSANKLSGEIPLELGNLSNLVKLRLKNNQLTGKIPASLGSLPNLVTLIMSENQLTGDIPPELGNIPNLQTLYLTGNPLTGCIPEALWPIPNHDLRSLDLPTCP